MSQGEALPTLTPWERQRLALAQRYGTADVDEAIRREYGSEPKMEMDAAEFIRVSDEKREAGTDPHDKLMMAIERESERRRQMSAETDATEIGRRRERRACKWIGCNTDITGTHSRTLYCSKHKDPATKVAAENRRARKAAGEPAKKPAVKAAHHREAATKAVEPVPEPVLEIQLPPKAQVGLGDLVELVPSLRIWETDTEAKAYLVGFLWGRQVA